MKRYSFWIVIVLFACRSATPLIEKAEETPNTSINYRLHDIWALREIDGRAVGDAQAAAYLEFNLTTKKVYGNTGCNSLSADLFVDADSLRIMNMAVTEMYCDNFQQEQDYVTNLMRSMHYEIDGLSLTLISNETNFSFRKVD